MKKLLLFVSFVFCVSNIFAQDIDVEAAKDSAFAFFNQPSKSKQAKAPEIRTTKLDLVYTGTVQAEKTFYVFNRNDSLGFVIVAAKEGVRSVLGYAYKGSFNPDSISPVTREWLQSYSRQILELSQARTQRKAATLSSYDPILPMTVSLWGQDAPYNNKCPYYNSSSRCVAGCVPVAFAQLMFFDKWPETGEGSNSYTCNPGRGEETISVDFSQASYKWSKMLVSYDAPTTNKSKDAVAELMYHVGVASNTIYGASESTTSFETAAYSLPKYFKYAEDISIEYRKNYGDELWESMLYSELKKDRPVPYAAFSDKVGHAFLIDGYEAGYYHVNWGWNGSSNGYFLLSALRDFAYDHSMVLNLRPKRETVASSQLKYGYCNEAVLAYGSGDGVTGGVIAVPAKEMTYYKGKKVVGMEIGLANDVTGLKCFITKDLSGTPIVSQEIGEGSGGWNIIKFDTPVLLDGSQLYVGYNCDAERGYYPVARSNRTDTERLYGSYSCYHYYESSWHNKYGYNLAIRMIIEDEDLPVDMRLTQVDDIIVNHGEKFNITGIVESMSIPDITSYVVNYQINSGSVNTYTVNTNLKTNGISKFSIPVENNLAPGYYDLKVWISKVNTTTDAIDCNSNYWKSYPASLRVRGVTYPRKHVVETNLSVECGYSPRAVAAMIKMNEKYPDTFIGINIHTHIFEYDPMEGAENYYIYGGVPGSRTDRVTDNSASFEEMESDFLRLDDVSDVFIQATAAYNQPDESEVLVDTHLKFGFKDETNYYNLAYVIVEDSVGPYPQTSYYGDTAIDGWNNESTTYHMFVARGIYGSFYGTSNSIPRGLEAESDYNYKYIVKLPTNIDNKKYMSVIVMVINRSTGEIANAVKLKPSEFTTGIQDVGTETDKTVIYNLAGQKMQKPQRGINLVNGRKVILK